MWLLILIETGVPAILLLAMALPRFPDRLTYFLSAFAFVPGLLFAWLVFPWDVSSLYFRDLLPLLTVIALAVGYRRIATGSGEKPGRAARVLMAVLNVGIGAALMVLCWYALVGYPAPDDPVQLASPLRDGSFVVGQGGGSPFINGHARVAPQNHALDILGLDAWGRRSSWGGDPADLSRFAIFGSNVYAPCDGLILLTVDGLPDLPAGERDTGNLAGNHVVIECQGIEVVLAHLQRDSVRVSTGQRVTRAAVLGKVGNSGNTSEPHLHMHAEIGGGRGVILDGRAVPMLIDGRYLVRGDRL